MEIYDIVQLLCRNSADVNLQNVDGYTALMYASSRNKYEVVKTLLLKDAKINMQNHSGWTALMCAVAFEGLDEVIDLLCDHGANVDFGNDEGYSAMMYAQSRDD